MSASILPNPFMTDDAFEAIVRRMIDDIARVVADLAARARP
jgi:hypothetical protein